MEQGLAETLLTQGPDALLLLTTSGIISYVNPAAERLFGYESCDLVGLTCMSHQASRAYQIADEFRRRGKPVVLAGRDADEVLAAFRAARFPLVLGQLLLRPRAGVAAHRRRGAHVAFVGALAIDRAA